MCELGRLAWLKGEALARAQAAGDEEGKSPKGDAMDSGIPLDQQKTQCDPQGEEPPTQPDPNPNP